MEKKNAFTKILAITGTVLVWVPILAPILLTGVLLITERVFRFDFLMPAELFPAALIGSGLLIWAAWRAQACWKLIACELGIAIAALVGSQGLAVLTGLASGETEPTGWPFVLVLTVFGIFILALLAIDVVSVLVMRDLFKPRRLLAGHH